MGCSPTKGQLFSKKDLPSAPQELPCNGKEVPSGGSLETETQDNATIPGNRSVVCDDTVTGEDVPEEHLVQRRGSQDKQIVQMKEGTKQIKAKDKQGKRRKPRKQKLRNTSYLQSKSEFILIAHQAAYAYLNPSISKFESLLGLLEQTAQIRSSLQTTVASLVMHYEEINQALEEMAVEGEQMLWEHGNYMMWPTSQNCPSTATKPNNKLNFSELPSELLQQMLQHSTRKTVSLGDSVKCLGDSALQELADYFGSQSQLLKEKLLAKHAAEGRLKKVLTHVEAAVFRKANPEDSALHSEDSGIGADNECQNGSDRLRHHRSSCGSGANTGTTSVCTMSTSSDQQLLHGNGEVTDNDDDDDDDDDNDDNDDAETEEASARDEQTDKTRETINGSSEADSSHLLIQTHDKVNSNLKRKTRRPKTADNSCQVKLKQCHLEGPKRSQSTECLCSTIKVSDLNKQQRTQNNKLTLEEFVNKNSPEKLGHARTKIRRHSSGGQNAAMYNVLQYGSKGPFRALQPNSPPTITPEPPGRNAVRRLINTFSQGVDGPLDPRPMKTENKNNKKCGLSLLVTNRRALITNGNKNSSIHPPESKLADRPENLDLDNLPPPPPEMLIDNSFEKSVGLPYEEGAHGSQCRQQCTSMQRETVAPNRPNMQQDSMSYSATHPVRQNALFYSCLEQGYNQAAGPYSKEEEATISQHLQKILYLPQLPSEIISNTDLANGSTHRSTINQGYVDHNEGDAVTLQSKFLPPTTPPVSRTRLPPSCPTVHYAVPRLSAAFPPCRKWTPSITPTTSSKHRETMAEENDPPVSSSQPFSETQTLFCQDNQLVPHTRTSSCSSTLPRPWGEPARKKLPTARLQPAFMRCSPSGYISSHSEQQQLVPNAKQEQDQGSDVTTVTHEGTNIVTVLAEGNRSDRGTIDPEPHTTNLTTHSMLEGEEITD